MNTCTNCGKRLSYAAMEGNCSDWSSKDHCAGEELTQAKLAALAKGDTQVSDGSTARYYELPEGAAELQDLIAFRDMNAQMGEIFRACYRYGQVAHSPKVRDIKKIIFYAQAELARLEKYGEK